MNPATLTLSTILLATASLAAQTSPRLAIDVYQDAVKYRVATGQPQFLGAVILSLSDQQRVQLPGVPALLDQFVVAGVGQGQSEYTVAMPIGWLPVGVKVYAQGIVADTGGISTTGVLGLLLPQR